MNVLVETVCAHKSELAESPVWDAYNNRIYWVDILPGILHWYNFYDSTNYCLEVGKSLSSVALAGDGQLVAVIEDGFYFIDTASKSVTLITAVEKDIPTNRFNDGKCDPAGRFFAGTMSRNNEPAAGKLYMLDVQRRVFTVLSGVGCSNGLTWNSDGSVFYFIDTLRRSISAYDFDVVSGKIARERIIRKFNRGEGLPDGMTTDSEGALWIAMWNGWNVSRIDPETGEQLFRIELPVSQPTSCTFGGPSYSNLYITSARVGLSDEQLSEQPLAGSLFIIKNLGSHGFPPALFKSSRYHS